MRKQSTITALSAAMGMLILILDSRTALSGTSEGIDLCIRTLIPSLFPFFILSILLTGSLLGQPLCFLRPVGKLCSIPEGAESLLAIGLLGGYPVGAQNICLAVRQGQLSQSDGERMLGFCSNAGPSFLFGIIAPMFGDLRTVWLLWIIHLLSAVATGMMLPRSTFHSARIASIRSPTLSDALEKALKTMAQVCGWVILFRMVLAVLERWLFQWMPSVLQVMFSGLLELSNGCVRLGEIEAGALRFLIGGILLSLGGCCVTMQTLSICSGVSLRLYFPGKILQCLFSVLLTFALQPLLPQEVQFPIPPVIWLIAGATIVFLVFFLRKTEKTSSFPSALGV